MPGWDNKLSGEVNMFCRMTTTVTRLSGHNMSLERHVHTHGKRGQASKACVAELCGDIIAMSVIVYSQSSHC